MSDAPLFPIKERKPGMGMVYSTSGVLLRAAERCNRTRDAKQLTWPLEELNKHIEELRASTDDADAVERLHQFLSLWV